LAQAICSDQTLARNELGYVVAYQAARQSLQAEADKRTLAEAATAFAGRAADECGLARSGQLKSVPSVQVLDCLNRLFLRERDSLASRLSGPARAEAELSPLDAINIQRALREQGYLPTNATTDGVVGPATRAAIVAWQQATGVSPTSFASKAMLADLNKRPAARIPSGVSVSTGQTATFGDCRNADTLQGYSAQSFVRDRPVLGIPPSMWTPAVLGQALTWARNCLDAARARGDVVPPRTTVERWLSSFSDAATQGMALRDAREDAPRLDRQAAELFHKQIDEEAPLPSGGFVSCSALGEFQGLPTKLDDQLFGQALRAFTDADYAAIEKKLAECTAMKPVERALQVERVMPGTRIQYYPDRPTLRALPGHVDELRRIEAYELAMRDPARRAEAEAQEKERRFSPQESQIRRALEGKAIRTPSANASEHVIYCGGYFTLQRAIEALIRADLTPSADDSAMRALAFQTLAQTWLANRRGVLGDEAVNIELMPFFYAGLTAGISADVDKVKPFFRSCMAAAEELGRERAKLK
jgi:hypothetical protein